MNPTPSVGVESNGKPPIPIAVSVAPVVDRVVIHCGDVHIGLPIADALVFAQQIGDAIQTLLDQTHHQTTQ
jgi:hypothetical protein